MDRRQVAQVPLTGGRSYTFADHLGTPLLQTDANAAVTWHAEYEPFGHIYEMRTGSRGDQPLRFPGQEAAMNWEGQEKNYNIFRWYRAGWGRYTQADPLGPAGDANPYGYAEQNSFRFVDPYGLKAEIVCASISIFGLQNTPAKHLHDRHWSYRFDQRYHSPVKPLICRSATRARSRCASVSGLPAATCPARFMRRPFATASPGLARTATSQPTI